jgi:excisionase family DNA binding protein
MRTFLTTEEAADALNLSIHTLRQYLRRGLIPYKQYYKGGKIHIPADFIAKTTQDAMRSVNKEADYV